jgi:Family of unknown function (DUF6178)
MSRSRNRDTTPPRESGASVDDRLARLLDTPLLARIVPHLTPETLQQLIRYRGLDACGEIVTSATPAQLIALLDLDLWRHAQAGHDDHFDVDRFGEWLEVLVDTGESAAARTVAALDKQLVIVGLSRYLRVFDPGTFEPTASSDDEPTDRDQMMNSETSGDVVECEVGGYLVRARRTDAWDAIITLLVTLETEHDHYFHAVMQGCRRLSNSRPEIDGLDDLLIAPEQHLLDVSIEREQRRSRQGYATPADARAFLQMARQPPAASASPIAPTAGNPIAAAYFRATEEEEEEDVAATLARPVGEAEDVHSSINAVIELLAEAGQGATPLRPRALLGAAGEEPRAAKLPLLTRLMGFVLHHDETAYFARSRELGFLANTLLAGSSIQSRPFTPQEASDAAACTCNLGLECHTAVTDAFLVDHDLVAAFEVGWSVLYRDVSLFVTDQLIATLTDVHALDADTDNGLHTLRRTLVKQREAGTPWLARDAADVLTMLDVTAWISVLGLLDECPIVPAALTAVLERRTTSVSATAFEFISTTKQIGDIRLFTRTLGTLLGMRSDAPSRSSRNNRDDCRRRDGSRGNHADSGANAPGGHRTAATVTDPPSAGHRRPRTRRHRDRP